MGRLTSRKRGRLTQGTAVASVCYKCKQPKKAFPAGSEGKPSFANKSTLDAAAIEQMRSGA